MCIARQINHPDTLEAIGFPDKGWNWRRATKIMDERKAAKLPVYTGAYMITASYREITQGGQSKNETYCKNVLGDVWKARRKDPWWEHWHLETAWEALCKYRGFGGFMAYEVISDLRWTRYLKDAPDIMTWANAGPGAIRGLNRVHGRKLNHRITKEQAVDEMHELLTLAPHFVGTHVPINKIEMREIEHSLCEYDKYTRVAKGEGRPRAKYPGR